MSLRILAVSGSFLLLTCCAFPASAQTNSLPATPQQLLDEYSSSGRSNIATPADDTHASLREKANTQPPSELDQAKQTSRQWQKKDGEQLTVFVSADNKECAHILVYKAPNVDPSMVQEVPKQFASNMPRLQGPAPRCCEQDRGDELAVQQRKPFNPRGKFLPAPGKPAPKLLP